MEKYKIENCVCLLFPLKPCEQGFPYSINEENEITKKTLEKGLGFIDAFTTYGLIKFPTKVSFINNEYKGCRCGPGCKCEDVIVRKKEHIIGGALAVIPFESPQDVELFKSRIVEYNHLFTDLIDQDDLDRLINKNGFTRLRNNRFKAEIVEEWKRQHSL